MHPVDPDTVPLTTDALATGLALFKAAEPDHEQAVYWFSVAAAEGDAEGLAMYAYCQLEGLGLPRDPEQARIRLEHASALGSLTAKFNLARMLVAGWGGAPDAVRGVALYTTAAALGHADATFNLASCLDAGWGCQPDRLAAKALFLRARALGSPLKAPGVRVRQQELAAVRELARRFEDSDQLPRLIEERQHELTLMLELVTTHPRRKKKRLSATYKQRVAALTGIASLVGGVAGALVGALGWRGRRSGGHDAGPTSIV